MAAETFTIDHASDGGLVPLLLMGSANYSVTAFSAPAANPKPLWAASIDTEGALRADPGTYENRTLSLTVEAHDTAGTSTHEDALRAKVAKVHREGGTARWVRKDGSVRVFDLLAGDQFSLVRDIKYENGRAEIQLSFTALPATRDAEQDLGDNVETTLPALIFTEASIPGEVPALGRLVIDNDGTIPWWGAIWGIESRNYSASANAALRYEAESRTTMGGSTAVAALGASGANAVLNTSLLTTYQAILSTQASGGGAHLSHIGQFRVLARVNATLANTGTVSIALEWGEGDFLRFQQNPAVTLDPSMEGAWLLVDLGLVSPRQVISGAQRWEGRILAKSTVAGDDVYIDTLELIPVDEGSGQLEAVFSLPTPTSLSGRDEFTGMTVGSALNGRVAPSGGTWATSGGTDDFLGNAGFPLQVPPMNDVVRRLATNTTPRIALLGSTNLADSAVSARLLPVFGGPNERTGLVLRGIDASNYLAVSFGVDGQFRIDQVVAGVTTTLVNGGVIGGPEGDWIWTFAVNAAGDMRAFVFSTVSGSLLKSVSASSAAAATGGALASGKPGLYDRGGTGGGVHYYDDVRVWVPPRDAGVFAGQSAQIRHDGAFREDSAGTTWQPPSSYIGDYLLVPNSGAEARTARVIVRPIYHPGSGGGVARRPNRRHQRTLAYHAQIPDLRRPRVHG